MLPTTAETPSARAAPGFTSIGDNLFVFGGRDSSARQNDIYKYNISSNQWSKLSPLGRPPVPRSFHSMVAISNNCLLSVGGLSQNNVHLNDIQIYNIGNHFQLQVICPNVILEKNCWVQPKVVTTSLPARGFYTLVTLGTNVFVFGGSADFDPALQENKTYFNTLLKLDSGNFIFIPRPYSYFNYRANCTCSNYYFSINLLYFLNFVFFHKKSTTLKIEQVFFRFFFI